MGSTRLKRSGPTCTPCCRCQTDRSPTIGSRRTTRRGLRRSGRGRVYLGARAWKSTHRRSPMRTSSITRTCICATSANRSHSSPKESPKRSRAGSTSQCTRRQRSLGRSGAEPAIVGRRLRAGRSLRSLSHPDLRHRRVPGLLRAIAGQRDPAVFAANFQSFWGTTVDDAWAAIHTLPPGLFPRQPRNQDLSVLAPAAGSRPAGSRTIRRARRIGPCPIRPARPSRSQGMSLRASSSRIAPVLARRCRAEPSSRDSTTTSPATFSLRSRRQRSIRIWRTPARRRRRILFRRRFSVGRADR